MNIAEQKRVNSEVLSKCFILSQTWCFSTH